MAMFNSSSRPDTNQELIGRVSKRSVFRVHVLTPLLRQRSSQTSVQYGLRFVGVAELFDVSATLVDSSLVPEWLMVKLGITHNASRINE